MASDFMFSPILNPKSFRLSIKIQQKNSKNEIHILNKWKELNFSLSLVLLHVQDKSRHDTQSRTTQQCTVVQQWNSRDFGGRAGRRSENLEAHSNTRTFDDKQDNFEGKAEAFFHATFKAQSQLENISKIMGVICEGGTNRAQPSVDQKLVSVLGTKTKVQFRHRYRPKLKLYFQ